MRWDGFLAQGRLRSETPISQAPESRSAQEVRGAAAGGRDTEKYLGSSMHSGDWARDPACFLPRVEVLTLSGSPVIRDTHKSHRSSLGTVNEPPTENYEHKFLKSLDTPRSPWPFPRFRVPDL